MDHLPQIVSKRDSKRSQKSNRSSRRKSSGSIKSGKLKSKSEIEKSNEEPVQESPTISYRERITSMFFNYMYDTLIDTFGTSLESSVTLMNRYISMVGKVERKPDDTSKSESLMDDHTLTTMELYEELGSHINREKQTLSLSRQIFSLDCIDRQTSREIFEAQSMYMEDTLNISITFKNGNQYCGDVINRVMHGNGIFFWSDGTIYEGEFRNGHPTGKGIMILPDLTTYNGEFCKGEFHGWGSLNIVNSSMFYSGQWVDGKKHGKGWMLYDSQNWYDGEWRNHLREGYGIRKYNGFGKYKGYWRDGERHGKGVMLYDNTDFYKGEWRYGLLHGYGEYTWDTTCTDCFTYSIQPWYKGTWKDGERNGAGIMNFGSESGSKLAGIWSKNLKHGPGVMICGTGQIIHRNPLFLNDKALQYEENTEVHNIDNGSSKALISGDLNPTKSYQDIIKEINKKIAINNINKKIISVFPTPSTGRMIPESEEKPFEPLDTPIHGAPENVNMEYFLNEILKSASAHEIITIPPENRRLAEVTDLCNRNTIYKTYLERPLTNLVEIEAKQLKNTLTQNLTVLKEIYHQYATLASKRKLPKNFKPLLIKLFLWQLYRDIGIPSLGISLIDLDSALTANPQSYIEADHDPFETIYFGQFLQSLMATAALMYSRRIMTVNTNGSIASKIFVEFLNNYLLPNTGKFTGIALTTYRDLLPIKNVQLLYLSIGEAHTVRDFLLNICVKKGYEPPYYLIIKNKPDDKRTCLVGENTVPFEQEVAFFPYTQALGEPMEVKESCIPEDEFRQTLYSLRFLGCRSVINCLTEVCPVIKKSGFIVNMDYKLSFLEFYEVLLLCTVKYISRVMNKKERYEKYERVLKERAENPVPVIVKGKADKGKDKKKKDKH